MFFNIGNCFWAQMNVEAFINMEFSANVQIDDPAEQGTSEIAVPGNPQQHEALHVGLPHSRTIVSFKSSIIRGFRLYTLSFMCPIRRNPLG
jgi:hypothetical protein